MKANVKKTIKFTTGVCAALGIVTIGAVVASGTAVKVVAEGLKAGVKTMKKTIAELQAEKGEPGAAEVMPADEKVSPVDFEN